MELSDGFVLIESLQKFRADDVACIVKVLQATHEKKTIPHWLCGLEETARSQFLQRAVACYLHLTSSAKLARGFFKILTDLPQEHQAQIQQYLETSMAALIGDPHPNSTKTLCELLNVSPTAKELCKNLIVPTSSLVADKLTVSTHGTSERQVGQDLDGLYYTLKVWLSPRIPKQVCVYCLQTFGDVIGSCLCQPGQGNPPTHNHLQPLWNNILHCLLSLLFQRRAPEVVGLLGTAISMMVNLAPNVAQSSRAYRDIILVILGEKERISVFQTGFEVPLASLSSEDKDVCALMLTKSILMTGCRKLLSHRDISQQSLLLFLFPYIMRPCQGSHSHHYAAFHVLSLWFQKVKIHGVTPMVELPLEGSECMEVVGGRCWMSPCCPILSSTLSTIWLHWDSPVDGVADCVSAIFEALLHIWSTALGEGRSGYSQLGQELMERVLMMSWHTKSRYRPLATLLAYVDVVAFLGKHPQLKEDLVKSMGVNSLAAVVSDVYKGFLHQIKTQCLSTDKCPLSVWCDLWMQTLLSGMLSASPIQRMKVSTYWIPHSFRIIQGSHLALLEALQGRIKNASGGNAVRNLLAWTSVCGYARDILGMDLLEHHYVYVREALVCIHQDVRCQALSLLCNTLKRSTPVSRSEIDLLKSFIRVNLKTDSTSFRQNMVSALKKLVTRIRDSCLVEVRLHNLSSDVLKMGVDFIDWFFHQLVQSLYPGGSYQLRQTVLDLMESTLNLLVYRQQHVSKKGKAQEGAEILLQFANQSGQWRFFSQQNFLILLSCLEDGSDDIQTQCFKLLVEFFAWPDESQWKSSQLQSCDNPLTRTLSHKMTVVNLINKALSLASSPKTYESHSGLLLMSLVLKKHVGNIGLIFQSVGQCRVSDVCLFDKDSSCTSSPASDFLHMIIHFLETSVSAVKKDPAGEFKDHPVHGLTRYATQCLREILSWSEEVGSLAGSLERLKDLNLVVVDLMLAILSGGSNLDQCPSFAQMGVALDSLISGEDGDDEVTTLSPHFQMLLSWCWINLKESCTSLGHVTASAFKGDKCLLSSSAISDIGEIFVRVLTTCRHRGAIEGCRSGFSLFCQVLLSCKVEKYWSIPKAMVSSIVHSLQSNSLSGSVSRRSAGLPIIVEIVADQVVKTRQDKTFLKSMVEQFYGIACQPLTSDHSQQRDLSQVHAFNILKAVFCHAGLATHLTAHLSQLTISVIQNFDSPSWAIRNAATQLISTLVTRIFGQRNKMGGSMTLEEMDSLHPGLLAYLLARLQALTDSQSLINPSLYVVLTLLSNLAMSPSHLHGYENRRVLHSLLSSYVANPVYWLRNLSARSLVALCPSDRVDQELWHRLADVAGGTLGLNALHGHLLCVYHLVSWDAFSTDTCHKTLEFFCQHPSLFFHSSTCFLPSTQVVLIIQRLVHRLHAGITTDLSDLLWTLLKKLFSVLSSSNVLLQAGAACCMRECFLAMALVASQCQSLHTTMVRFISSTIPSANRDIRQTIVSTLHAYPHHHYMACQAIQETLWQNLMGETSAFILAKSCDILYNLCDKSGSGSGFPGDLVTLEGLMETWGHIDSVKAAILVMQGIVFNHTDYCILIDRPGPLQSWCQTLVDFTTPVMNENLRLSAARALAMGGVTLLGLSNQNPSHHSLRGVAVSIVRATVQCLEDSETLVREAASIFVSDLMAESHTHSSRALHLLSQYVSQKMWCDDELYVYLLQQLYGHGELTRVIKETLARDQQCQRLFEPDLESILSELPAKKLWTFQILTQCPKTAMLTHLRQKGCEASGELQAHMKTFSLSVEGFLLNVSTNPKVMGCLLGILFLDRLCVDVDEAQELHRVVQQLLKLPYLHPLLSSMGLEEMNTSQRSSQDVYPQA